MPTSKRPMAVKTSKQEAANRKVERMLGENAARQRRQVAAKENPRKQMAVKVPGKMGPSRRAPSSHPKTRKTDYKPGNPHKPEPNSKRTEMLHKRLTKMLDAREVAKGGRGIGGSGIRHRGSPINRHLKRL